MMPTLPRRLVIAGGSGFLGVSLAHHLAAGGWRIVILSRHRPRPVGPWEHVAWDARSIGQWAECLDGAAGLVNLVGRTVDCVKTPDHCDEILRSRVESTRILGSACRAAAAPLVLRTDPEIALYGRYVKSRRLEQEGFTFRYPHLPEALAACFAASAANERPRACCNAR
jgi:NAD dependent epimerase/dehydratase family enzyme